MARRQRAVEKEGGWAYGGGRGGSRATRNRRKRRNSAGTVGTENPAAGRRPWAPTTSVTFLSTTTGRGMLHEAARHSLLALSGSSRRCPCHLDGPTTLIVSPRDSERRIQGDLQYLFASNMPVSRFVNREFSPRASIALFQASQRARKFKSVSGLGA